MLSIFSLYLRGEGWVSFWCGSAVAAAALSTYWKRVPLTRASRSRSTASSVTSPKHAVAIDHTWQFSAPRLRADADAERGAGKRCGEAAAADDAEAPLEPDGGCRAFSLFWWLGVRGLVGVRETGMELRSDLFRSSCARVVRGCTSAGAARDRFGGASDASSLLSLLRLMLGEFMVGASCGEGSEPAAWAVAAWSDVCR